MRRKFWGWGLEGEGLAASELEQLGAVFTGRLGIDGVRAQEPPRVQELDLRAPRLVPPASLERAFSTDPYDRAAHTYGRSFRDLVRAFRRDYAHAPDLVAFPRGEDELVSVLDWCCDAGVAAIPFGGGSSVVGGVEPDVGDGYRGVISVDLRHLQGVLEVDRTSRAARIAAGTLGPELEAQLKPHGLTLRHFPQSFEWSTLGGWIATRSGGHFATLHTHIDEFVEAVRVVTPRGVLQTRRLPASGAGPSAERLFCGSEGTLGVITEAWMRVQPRPRFRAGASVLFADFADAVQASLELAQSGLHPANCRLLGHDEALMSGSGDGSQAILVLGFESADHELGPWLARALEICAGHRGEVTRRGERSGGGLAGFVPARRAPARRPGPARADQRDLRDGRHLGSLLGVPRGRTGGHQAGGAPGLRRRRGLVPFRVRLPRRPFAVLLSLRTRASGPGTGAMG